MDKRAILNINSLAELLQNVKDNKIAFGQPSKSKILWYEQLRIKNRNYTGRFANIRRIIVALFPLYRYKIALQYYNAIKSFRSEDFRMKLSERTREDIINNACMYKQAYELLDEASKQIYINMLLFRLTGDYIFSIYSESHNTQYFSDKLSWGGMDIVL